MQLGADGQHLTCAGKVSKNTTRPGHSFSSLALHNWSLTVSASASEPARCRVYIVDDEWIIAQTLAAILCKEGFQAQAFHNPDQVLVRSMEHPPDVLITDVMMPGMTGIELAISLRRAGHQSRIILFSGQAGSMDLLCDARRRGYEFELLEKPLHPLQLILRLNNLRTIEARRPSSESSTPSPESGSRPAA
jgi:DNA-binding response OmpR family regulator